MHITHGSFDHITASVTRANRFCTSLMGVICGLGGCMSFVALHGGVWRFGWRRNWRDLCCGSAPHSSLTICICRLWRRKWIPPADLCCGGAARGFALGDGGGIAQRRVPYGDCRSSGTPNLTSVRRLHLAAEASGKSPFAALLTPHHGGASGVETRFSCPHTMVA